MHEDVIEKLYQEYSMHGYISEDRIFSVLEEKNISLLDSDSIVDKLLSRGVIVRDELLPEPDDDDDYDKGHYNYEEIFITILELEPEMQSLIDYVRNIQAPQHREWQVLLPQAKNGNVFARNRLFEMYMRSALRIALQFSQKYDQPLSDTIQNAFIGLYISIDKFEFGRQDNFPQYYPLWIIQQIRREAEPFNPTVYYPIHVKEKMFLAYDVFKNFSGEKYISNSINLDLIFDVMQNLKCDEKEAYDLINSTNHFYSLEKYFESDENFDIEDKDETLLEMVEHRELTRTISLVLNSLTEREAKILELRYGLIDGEEHTLEDVGCMFGVTRERIRQIESKAIRKLRHPSISKKLRDFLD